jgi:mRNA interferase MazF
MKIRRGDIWLIDLEPVRSGELGKRRPCLIISDNLYNQSAPTLLVMPITSYAPTIRSPSIKASTGTGLSKDSSILPLHVRAVVRSRFIHRLGRAPAALADQAAEILIFVVGQGRYRFS